MQRNTNLKRGGNLGDIEGKGKRKKRERNGGSLGKYRQMENVFDKKWWRKVKMGEKKEETEAMKWKEKKKCNTERCKRAKEIKMPFFLTMLRFECLRSLEFLTTKFPRLERLETPEIRKLGEVKC